jgi:hypothetical protein
VELAYDRQGQLIAYDRSVAPNRRAEAAAAQRDAVR